MYLVSVLIVDEKLRCSVSVFATCRDFTKQIVRFDASKLCEAPEVLGSCAPLACPTCKQRAM
eukprot:SAG11_NODE_23783_length_383_cov_0.728873_2_plen_61_part_01